MYLYYKIIMESKTKSVDIVKHGRTLSEEFKTQSPYTQQYIKCLVGTTPTSNPKGALTEKAPDYTGSSPNTRANIHFWLGIK
jgi:hypothetical protein